MGSPPSPLTSLPFEVRTLIYLSIIGSPPPSLMVFYNEFTQKIDRRASMLPISWLHTCRLIHAEGWALVARLTPLVWSLHSSGGPSAPKPQNQLSDILGTTFLKKLRSLEVRQNCPPPTTELLRMSELRSIIVQVFHREEIVVPLDRLSLRKLLSDSKAMENAISLLPRQSQPQNMPFLRARTKIYIRLKAEFWHRHRTRYCRGFCICLGLKFEMATRAVTDKQIWLNVMTVSDCSGFGTWSKVGRVKKDESLSEFDKRFKEGERWGCGCLKAAC